VALVSRQPAVVVAEKPGGATVSPFLPRAEAPMFLPSSSSVPLCNLLYYSSVFSFLYCSPLSLLFFSLPTVIPSVFLLSSSPLFFLSGAADARALAGSAALCFFFILPVLPVFFFSFVFLPSSPSVFLLSLQLLPVLPVFLSALPLFSPSPLSRPFSGFYSQRMHAFSRNVIAEVMVSW